MITSSFKILTCVALVSLQSFSTTGLTDSKARFEMEFSTAITRSEIDPSSDLTSQVTPAGGAIPFGTARAGEACEVKTTLPT